MLHYILSKDEGCRKKQTLESVINAVHSGGLFHSVKLLNRAESKYYQIYKKLRISALDFSF